MSPVIRRFNASLTFRSVWAFVLSLAGYGMAAGFVWVLLWIFREHLAEQRWWLPVGIVGFWSVLTTSGWRRWRAGQGFYGPADSMAFFDFNEENAGAWMVQNQTARLTGPAWLLSQMFLAGPIQALKGASLLRARLPDDVATELRLKDLLESVRAKGSWHPVDTWAGREEDISSLIRLGKLEFSSRTGRLRVIP